MAKNKQAILYIDGENLKYYVRNVCNSNGLSGEIDSLNFDILFSSVLGSVAPVKKRFYAAKLRFHKDFPDKSNQLIQRQRAVKSILSNQGFDFIVSGNVRGQKVKVNGKNTVVFREKGVDVKIAIDMVAEACDKKVQTIVLCSSDSDLQPAITEVKSRGVEVVYLGFESRPNKGLIYTCDRTLLIRDSEIISAFSK